MASKWAVSFGRWQDIVSHVDQEQATPMPTAESAYMHVVDRDVLDASPQPLLLSLLLPYADALRTLNVPVGPEFFSRPWLRRLHKAVNSASIPAPLQEALLAIGDLASKRGNETLLLAALDQGTIVARRQLTMAPVELALRAYLFERDLFDASHARFRQLLGATAAITCCEFHAKRPSPGTCAPSAEELRLAIRKHLLARGEQQAARIVVEARGDDLLVVFKRHRPRRQPNPASLLGAPVGDDVLIYNAKAQYLLVHAQRVADTRVYRALMGAVIANDDDFFELRDVFSPHPLLLGAPEAFDTAAIPGIDRVVLRELTLLGEDGVSVVTDVPLTPAPRALSLGPLSRLLRRMSIVGWAFSVFLEGGAGPYEARVQRPNTLHLDRRVPLVALRQFLMARGYIVATGSVDASLPGSR